MFTINHKGFFFYLLVTLYHLSQGNFLPVNHPVVNYATICSAGILLATYDLSGWLVCQTRFVFFFHIFQNLSPFLWSSDPEPPNTLSAKMFSHNKHCCISRSDTFCVPCAWIARKRMGILSKQFDLIWQTRFTIVLSCITQTSSSRNSSKATQLFNVSKTVLSKYQNGCNNNKKK